MPWRPFLAASSSRFISGALKKSLLRSWASVVEASLFTLRRLVAIAACLRSACIYVARTLALLTCKEPPKVRPRRLANVSPADHARRRDTGKRLGGVASQVWWESQEA